MKILLLSPLPPPNGGMATWTEHYLSESKNCNEVYLVDTAFIGNRSSLNGKRINLFNELKRMFIILKKYVGILKREEIDAIHINSACTSTGIIRDAICVFLGKKKPIVFHCHCNVEDQLVGMIPLFLGRYVFNRVSEIVLLNKKSFEYVGTLTNTMKRIIPNAIEQISFNRSFEVKDQLTDIVFVGHVKREKGVREIIEVAKKMENVKFHLIGPMSDEINKYPKSNNVICYGRMDRKEALNKMYDADVLLFPSYTEGFSMVMLEAMSVGLPIIATDVGANMDMIENKGGIIIPSKSIEKIIDAISLIQNRELRLEMSTWNIEKVKHNYTTEVVFELLQEVYNEICI